MAETQYQITKETVHDPEESASRLLGWTFAEIGTMAGALVVVLIFVHLNVFGIGILILTYLWIKKLKKRFPDRYFTNMAKFLARPDKFFRASAPDSQWKPPIRD